MRRVIQFCQSKQDWWLQQPGQREGLSEPLAEGLAAYEAQQADMEVRIARAWTAKWACTRELARPLIETIMAGIPAPEGSDQLGTDFLTHVIELDLRNDNDDIQDDYE